MAFLCPNIMKIVFIPFQIGMQYENWEFDLEPVYDDKTLDKYKYIRDDIKVLFNHDIETIYLTFDLEILYKVEIVLKSTKEYDYQKLKNTISLEYGKVPTYNLISIWSGKSIQLSIMFDKNTNTIHMLIEDNKYSGLNIG